MGAGSDEVGPADHLAADEAPGHVRMDRGGRVQGGLAVPERPGTGLRVGGSEEGDEVELDGEPPDDVVECRRAAVPELRSLLGRQIAKLGLEREIDAVRAVHDRKERLRRQGLELTGQLVRPVAQRPLVVDVAEQALEQLHLGPETGIARLRLLANPLESPLHVVPVGDEQLELE